MDRLCICPVRNYVVLDCICQGYTGLYVLKEKQISF